jgi:O-antigen/teichoic acid export membrane protein
VISLTMRRVALAAYSRLTADREQLASAFARSLRLLLSITLPGCTALAMLAAPIISVVYGEKWMAAATVLAPLAALSAIRVATELAYDLLVAVGWTKRILTIQGCWVIGLVPTMILGAHLDGIRGVAVAHVVVALVVAVPLNVLAIHQLGVPVRSMTRAAVPALLASALVAAIIAGLDRVIDDPLALTLVALPLCAVVAIGVQWPVLRPFIASFRSKGAAS